MLVQAKKKLQRVREEKGKTQKQLAEDLKVGESTISNWEQEGRAFPRFDMLIKLKEYYDCDWDYLIGDMTCRKHDYNYVSEVTGLSLEASAKLIDWHDKGYNDLTDFGEILSDIIMDENFDKIIQYIHGMRYASNPTQEHYDMMVNHASLSSSESISETAVEQSLKDRFDVFWMRCGQAFNNMMDVIGKKNRYNE